VRLGSIIFSTLLACSVLLAGCNSSGGSGYRAESRCEAGKAGDAACKNGAGTVQEKPDTGY